MQLPCEGGGNSRSAHHAQMQSCAADGECLRADDASAVTGTAGARHPRVIAPASADAIARSIKMPEALVARYRVRRETLCVALDDAMAAADCDWGQLIELLHKVAGSAAYFGDGALGELARQLEISLQAAEEDADRRAILRRDWESRLLG